MKSANKILAEITARRTRLESDARAMKDEAAGLRKVEAALQAKHRPAPARRKKAKRS